MRHGTQAFFKVNRKYRYTVSLPPHVGAEVAKFAKALSTTDADYIARIATEWFARGCPAVAPEEDALRKQASSVRRVS